MTKPHLTYSAGTWAARQGQAWGVDQSASRAFERCREIAIRLIAKDRALARETGITQDEMANLRRLSMPSSTIEH